MSAPSLWRAMRLLLGVFLTIGFLGFHVHAEAGVGGQQSREVSGCQTTASGECHDQAKPSLGEMCGPSVCAAMPALEPRPTKGPVWSEAVVDAHREPISRDALGDHATPPPR